MSFLKKLLGKTQAAPQDLKTPDVEPAAVELENVKITSYQLGALDSAPSDAADEFMQSPGPPEAPLIGTMIGDAIGDTASDDNEKNAGASHSEAAAGDELTATPGPPDEPADDAPTEEVAFYYNKIALSQDGAPDDLADATADPEQMDGGILVVSAADGPMPGYEPYQWHEAFVIKGNNEDSGLEALAQSPGPPGEPAGDAIIGGFKSVSGMSTDGDLVEYREGGPPSQHAGLAPIAENPPGGVEYPNLSFYVPEADSDSQADGDTSTHEVGHYIGLDHTFDEGMSTPEGLAQPGPGSEAMDGAILVVSAADGPMPGPAETEDLAAAPDTSEAPSFFDGRLLSAQDFSDEQKPAWDDVQPGAFKTAGSYVPDAEPTGDPPQGDDASGAAIFDYDGAKAGYEIVTPAPGVEPFAGSVDALNRTSPDVVDSAEQDSPEPADLAIEPGNPRPVMGFMKMAAGTQDSLPPASVPVTPLAKDEAESLITGQAGVEAGNFQKVSGLAVEFDVIEDDEPSTLADLSRNPSLPAPIHPPPDSFGDFQDDDLPSL